jgi:glycopeptide antibiotics resistance protein
MSTRGLAAAVAIVGGVALAMVLFVPVAATHYRRHGRFTFGDLVSLLAGAVYGLALWTYTLLPLPADDTFACREPVTRWSQITEAIRAHPHDTLLDLARNPMVLQIALNVVLFVPLGVLLRVRARRGVVVAGLVGLATSLLIELTQYTGIWGLYPCAYRYFDIGDLVANPTGAVLGSVLAAVVAGRSLEPRVPVAPQLTRSRRLVAFVSDVLVFAVLGAMAVVAWRAWLLTDRTLPVATRDQTTLAMLQWGVPLALQAIAVLGWGRTIGEAVVQVRTRPRRRGTTVPARLIKLTTGVGALALLGAGVVPGSGWLLLGLLGLHLVAAVLIPGSRGLSNTLAGLDVELSVRPPVGATVGSPATGPPRVAG